MRASEIIRGVLDLIDQIDANQEVAQSEQPVRTGVDDNRFKQILDFITTQRNQQYDNSPAEVMATSKSVTIDAGGGVNGPKNPADIKSNSIPMYPEWQAEKK